MLTLNAVSPFARKANAPAFAGNDKKIPAIVVGQHAPIHPLQQDEWRKQLDVKRSQQAATERLLQQWKDFSEKFSGYSAPAVKNAVAQMTKAIEGQVKLAARYTNGKYENGLEKGYAEAPKDPNAPKFMRMQ